ncbi:hypothetical protein [Clostridium ihumii]|uniref:hypothetical protein n=1 Tax=Clostridium ihumii TaxID=1470356 RepID=UPI000687D37C|nr:hypothetical protein [Clostridium ihumii]
MKNLKMPLDKYYQIIKPTYIYLKVIPHKSNRNQTSSCLAKSICSMFKSVNQRIERIEKKYIYHTDWKFCYMIDMNKSDKNDICFYFIVPQHYKNLAKEKIREVWNKSDIEEVNMIKPFNNNSVKYQLNYKFEDALSLKINKSSNEPLNSILNAFDIMESGDRVSILYNFQYYGDDMWRSCYKNSITRWENHKSLERQHSAGYIFRLIANVLVEILDMLNGVINDLFTISSKNKENISLVESLADVLSINTKKLSESTLNKGTQNVLKTQIAIVSESSDLNRANTNALSVCQSYKALEEDNTLVYKKTKYPLRIEDKKFKGIEDNIFSTEECHNFLQSPGRELLNEYSIEHTKVIENPLPLELQAGTKYLGEVKYKEAKYNSYLENEYNIGNLPLVLIGSQGGGKTTYMSNYAHYCTESNESVIIIDFIKNCELSDSIKKVVSKEKIVEIDLGTEKGIQGLGYNEIAIKEDMSDFEKLKLANLQSQQVMALVDAISVGDPLSSRMRRYLNSAATIVLSQGHNSIKSVIDCLEKHDKRKKYISNLNDNLRNMLEDELNTLDELNEYSKVTNDNPIPDIIGTKASKIEHILDRIGMLREDFKLKYMYNKSLKDNINLVECMENGKVVLIKMNEQDFQSPMIKNIMVTYWVSKIWLASQIRGGLHDKPLRTNVIIDEVFQAPTCMNTLEYILPQSRKFGCKFVFSTQYIKQLERIFNTLEASGSSYMMLKGCLEDDFKHFKSKINNFEFEDLRDMKQFHSLNLIYYSKGYSSFISQLPKPIK